MSQGCLENYAAWIVENYIAHLEKKCSACDTEKALMACLKGAYQQAPTGISFEEFNTLSVFVHCLLNPPKKSFIECNDARV